MGFFTQWLTLINYYVYSFYQRWESDPVGYAVQVAGLLLMLNILELGMLFMLCAGISPEYLQPFTLMVLPVLVVVVVANYFLVYAKNKHHDTFFLLAHKNTRALHVDFYKFVAYFLLTVGPFAYLFIQKMIAK